VIGASHPLYTLVLAGLAAAGADLETAARVLGIVVFAGCVILAARSIQRLEYCG